MTKIIQAPSTQLYVPAFKDFIAGKVDAPIVLLSGGRGGAKSTSVAQGFGRAAIKRQFKRQAIIRKYFKYVRDSQYADIKTYLETIKADDLVDMGLSPLGFRFPGSDIISLGLDRAKIKSLSGVDRVWIEEATELTYDDWTNLMLTILRGKGKRQVVLTYNPQYNHWINEEFFHPDGSPKRSDTFYLHTTYKDNPFVGQMYCQLIESLSKELYDLHGLGLPMKLEGLIYPDYHIIDVFPDIQFGYGVDKGFNDAFAVVQTGYDDGNLYGHEVAYERFKTPTQMIRLLTDLGVDKDKPWWFDDSATDTIYEFQHAGFNAMAAGKGKIIDGINKMKSCQLHMTASSLNMQKEIGSYLWAKGLDGKFKDEPAVALQDHALDAWRYGSINVIRAEFSPVHSSLFGKRRTASR